MADAPVIVDQTTILAGAVGTNGSQGANAVGEGAAGGAGGAGGAGQSIAIAHDGQSLSGGSGDDQFTFAATATGGSGGQAGGGAAGGASSFSSSTVSIGEVPHRSSTTTSIYGSGGDGGAGGTGGAGGAASASNSNNVVNTGNGYDSVIFKSVANGGSSSGGVGAGVAGGAGAQNFTTGTDYYYGTSTNSVTTGNGGHPGDAGDGAVGGAELAVINANSVTMGGLGTNGGSHILTLAANSSGGWGGGGGSGVDGLRYDAPFADGGDAGDGAAGAASTSQVNDNTIDVGAGNSNISIGANAIGGRGGYGGVGGASGWSLSSTGSNSTDINHFPTLNASTTEAFGTSGDGGNGGRGGDARAEVIGNTVRTGDGFDTLTLDVSSQAGGGGGGGAAGSNGYNRTDVFNYVDSNQNSHATTTWTAGVVGISGTQGAEGTSTVRIAGNTFETGAGDDNIFVRASGSVGTVFEFSGNTFDGGSGTDRIDVSGLTLSGANISLAAGTLVTAGGSNSVRGIENVIGTNNNDIITGDGNANFLDGRNGNNTLTGGGGNDTIWGNNNGIDTAVFSGNRADYNVSVDASQRNFTITHARNITGGGDGTDTAFDVEFFSFGGQILTAAQLITSITIAIPTIALAAISDSGTSSADSITNVTEPIFVVTGAPGAIIKLSSRFEGSSQDTQSVTFQMDASGTRLVDLSGSVGVFADGVNDFIVSVIDPGTGAILLSLPVLAVTIDTTAPADAITSTGGTVTAAVQTITGTGEAGTTIQLYDGATKLGGTVTVDTTGHWTEQVTLSGTGVHVITAQDTDTAGNVGTSAAVTYTLAAPVTLAISTETLAADTGSSSTDRITKEGHVTLTGTVAGGAGTAGVQIFNGTTDLGAAVITNGTWTFTANLSEGIYNLAAVVTDAANQTVTSTAAATVVVDTTAPIDAITSTGGTVTAALQTILGTGETGTTIQLYDGATKLGGTVTVDATGHWTEKVTLSGTGAHVITAQDTDIAGNIGTSAAVTYTLAAPVAVAIAAGTLAADTGSSSVDRITKDGHVTLAGTVSGGVGSLGVHIFNGTTDLGAAVVTNGSWTFTNNLPEGIYNLVAVATDSANQTSTSTAAATVIVDTTAPVDAITNTGGTVTAAVQIISGTGETGTTIQLYDGATKLGGTVTVDTTGHWTEQVTLSGTGAHVLTAQDTDTAGNVGTSAAVTYTLYSGDIVGQTGQTTVNGTVGNDHIVIGATNLFVSAGAGNDVITINPSAGFQAHFINGGSGSNTLDLSFTTSGIRVDLSNGYASGQGIGLVGLQSIQNATGGTGNDTLIGGGTANILDGGAGNDTINGGGGNDLIIGGAGNDVLSGRAGNDLFIFRSAGGSQMSPGFGHDIVTDFQIGNAANHDTLDLKGLGFNSIEQIFASTTMIGTGATAHAIVTLGDSSIELQGVTKAQLIAHPFDFIFA